MYQQQSSWMFINWILQKNKYDEGLPAYNWNVKVNTTDGWTPFVQILLDPFFYKKLSFFFWCQDLFDCKLKYTRTSGREGHTNTHTLADFI